MTDDIYEDVSLKVSEVIKFVKLSRKTEFSISFSLSGIVGIFVSFPFYVSFVEFVVEFVVVSFVPLVLLVSFVGLVSFVLLV